MLRKFAGLFSRSRMLSSVNSGGDTISVVESGDYGTKELRYNGIVYSRFRKGNVYTGSYWDYFLPVAYAFDSPRILVIGLGGGTVQYQIGKLLGKSAEVSTVEIDQKVIDLWRRFFPKSSSRVFNADGAEFIKHRTSEYDIVILDAYKNLEIPAVFMESGFISDAYRSLPQKGVLAVNFAQSVVRAREMEDYIARLRSFFTVGVVRTSRTSDNVILVCLRGISKSEFMGSISRNMVRTKDTRRLLDAYRAWAGRD
jgi:spermidine synthase